MVDQLILYEAKEDIAFITLNRSEKSNALTLAMAAELEKAWERFEEDPKARVAILSSKGKNFCAGFDLNQGTDRLEALTVALPANGIKIFKPIVGAVQGWAVGMGYFLACLGADITIAADNARFSFPEAKVGVLGGLSMPIYHMPFKKMLELHMTGEPVDARKAYEMGIVNKVVAESELMSEARKIAENLKENAPLALRAIKYAAYKRLHESASLAALEYEMFLKRAIESEDMQEGIRAFAERRKPRYTGK